MYLYITLNSNLNATCSIDFPLYVENNSIKGDANGDGYVNISDAVLVKGYLLNCENYSISSERISCADVSGDNDGINIIDALKIQQYVVGLIDTF
jgi:mannan endo-1,4-beta-mannosidase